MTQKRIKATFTFEGKRYYCYGKTKEEAQAKVKSRRECLEGQKLVQKPKMSLTEWSVYCLDTYKSHLKEDTRKKLDRKLKARVYNVIGGMDLQEIRPVDCQKVFSLMAGMSKAYIKDIYQILSFVFNRAVDNSIIEESPMRGVTLPRGSRTERRSVTESERTALEEAFKNPRYRVFELMLYLGLRPSEARGAERKDIMIIRGKPVLHVRGTKTEKSDRYVPIPQSLYKKIEGDKTSLKIANNAFGGPLTEQSYKRAYLALKRDYDLNDDFVPYNLRHTYCSDLAKKGIDIRMAQYLMGHSDVRLTANIYTHIDVTTVLATLDHIL